MARRVLEEKLRSLKGINLDPCRKFVGTKKLKDTSTDKTGGTFSLQYNFDGSRLAAGFNGGGVKLFHGTTGDFISDLRPNKHGGFPTMCLRFHPNDPNMLFAATAEGQIYLMNLTNATCDNIITEKTNETNALDFSLDGYTYSTVGKDLTVRIYDTKTNRLIKSFEGATRALAGATNVEMEAGNTMRVFALKYHEENENIFLTGGWDNHIKIWDLRTNDGIKRQIHGPHICGDALDLKGNKILTGSWRANHALQEWDYREGTLLGELNFPHKSGAFLYCAQYADNNTVLAGGSGTDSVEVIDSLDNKVLGSVKMRRPVQALDCANGGRLFAVAGKELCIKFNAMVGQQ